MNRLFVSFFVFAALFSQSNAIIEEWTDELLFLAQISGEQMVPPQQSDLRMEFIMFLGSDEISAFSLNLGDFSIGSADISSLGIYGPAYYGDVSQNNLIDSIGGAYGDENGIIFIASHTLTDADIILSGQSYVQIDTLTQGSIRGQLEFFPFTRTPNDAMMNKIVEYNTIYTISFQPNLNFGESNSIFDLETDSDGMLLMHHNFLQPNSQKKLGPIENGDDLFVINVASLKCVQYLFGDTFIFTFDFGECTPFTFLPIGNEGFFKLQISGTNRCLRSDGQKLVKSRCPQASALYARNCIEDCDLDPAFPFLDRKRSPAEASFAEAVERFNKSHRK